MAEPIRPTTPAAARAAAGRRATAGAVLPAVLAPAVLAGVGACSDDSAPTPPAEPVRVADLAAGFPGAVVRQQSGPVSAAGQAPHVAAERPVIHVPFGWDVSYELEVPAGAVLTSLETKLLGTAVGRLEVVWTPAGGGERVLTRDLSAAPGRLAAFGNRKPETGRLTLRARASVAPEDPRAGVRVIEPLVMAGVPVDDGPAPRPAATGPNIVVYLIDALRADRLGCYGYPRPTSPNIDAFSATALRFADAQAQTSWTRPAVASIFTGLLPQQHRAIDKDDVLPGEAVTLPELLAGAGYRTAAVISNGNVARAFGFAQGFDSFKHLEQVVIGDDVVRSDDVNRAVFAWLDEERGPEPFFLYVHTVDPHLPYAPPEPFRQRFAPRVEDPETGSVAMVNELAAHSELVTPELIRDLSDLYDAEVAANDAAFGELMAGLEARGLAGDTVVVVLSDHGEEFFEHRGWTHGNTLFAEVLDVPLMIRIPGVEHGTVPQMVQHVDLFPTLLELAGTEPPDGIFGRSATRLWTGAPGEPWLERAVSHLDIRGRFAIAWADPRWKLHVRRLLNGTMQASLYDRAADRAEQVDLSEQHPELVHELRADYHETLDDAGVTLTDAEVDARHEAEVEAQLEALGYL